DGRRFQRTARESEAGPKNEMIENATRATIRVEKRMHPLEPVMRVGEHCGDFFDRRILACGDKPGCPVAAEFSQFLTNLRERDCDLASGTDVFRSRLPGP